MCFAAQPGFLGHGTRGYTPEPAACPSLAPSPSQGPHSSPPIVEPAPPTLPLPGAVGAPAPPLTSPWTGSSRRPRDAVTRRQTPRSSPSARRPSGAPGSRAACLKTLLLPRVSLHQALPLLRPPPPGLAPPQPAGPSLPRSPAHPMPRSSGPQNRPRNQYPLALRRPSRRLHPSLVAPAGSGPSPQASARSPSARSRPDRLGPSLQRPTRRQRYQLAALSRTLRRDGLRPLRTLPWPTPTSTWNYFPALPLRPTRTTDRPFSRATPRRPTSRTRTLRPPPQLLLLLRRLRLRLRPRSPRAPRLHLRLGPPTTGSPLRLLPAALSAGLPKLTRSSPVSATLRRRRRLPCCCVAANWLAPQPPSLSFSPLTGPDAPPLPPPTTTLLSSSSLPISSPLLCSYLLPFPTLPFVH
jgi:hypothetical protein